MKTPGQLAGRAFPLTAADGNFRRIDFGSPSRTRTYNLAVNLDLSGLALHAKQLFANPPGGFHRLDLPFPGHRVRPGGVGLTPDQVPRSVLTGVSPAALRWSVMPGNTLLQIIRMTDVEATFRVL
jgi:hypothetical protein